MKVIIDYQGTPFSLAHGGLDIQIQNTAEGLRSIGVEVELARWWDRAQKGDVIHLFSVPSSSYLKFAKGKGIPVVCSTLFTAACNHPKWKTQLKKRIVSCAGKLKKVPLVSGFIASSEGESFRECASNIVGLEAEADILRKVYGVPEGKIRILPLGLDQIFLNAEPGNREGDYLISTGTITERKRSIELAKIAHEMQIPMLFVGKPYSTSDPYWKHFEALIDGKFVRHIQHTDNPSELVKLLQNARGYVLDSYYENWCLAAHEAIACGIPILVPDQPWSRERFGSQATYWKSCQSSKAEQLKSFYTSAINLPKPDVVLYSWSQVALILEKIYQECLRGSKV